MEKERREEGRFEKGRRNVMHDGVLPHKISATLNLVKFRLSKYG